MKLVYLCLLFSFFSLRVSPNDFVIITVRTSGGEISGTGGNSKVNDPPNHEGRIPEGTHTAGSNTHSEKTEGSAHSRETGGTHSGEENNHDVTRSGGSSEGRSKSGGSNSQGGSHIGDGVSNTGDKRDHTQKDDPPQGEIHSEGSNSKGNNPESTPQGTDNLQGDHTQRDNPSNVKGDNTANSEGSQNNSNSESASSDSSNSNSRSTRGPNRREQNNSGTEHKNTSSFLGFLFGILAFGTAFPLLWYTEKRGVRIDKIIDEGENECVEVNNGRCIPETEGLLLCIHGEVSSGETLKDPIIGAILPNGLKLSRNVQILQHKEEKTEKSDILSYRKSWEDEMLSSSHFTNPKFRGKNEEKSSKTLWNQDFLASELRVGDYILNNELKEGIPCYETLKITEDMLNFDEIRAKTGRNSIEINENILYICKKNRFKTKIGDLRVQMSYVSPPKSFTVVARQHGATLEPYYGKCSMFSDNINQHGSDLESHLLLKYESKHEKKDGLTGLIKRFMDDSIKINWIFEGSLPKGQCFQNKLADERTKTRNFRLIGILCMILGVYFFLAPTLVLLQLIPVLGTVISVVFFMFSLGIGLALSLFIFAMGWIFYKPAIGGALAAGGVFCYIVAIIMI